MAQDSLTNAAGSDAAHQGRIATFYDDRVENADDLNTRCAQGVGLVYHHSGIVREDEVPPAEERAALMWLYRSEQALTDFVWNLVTGIAATTPRRILDVGCGEGATLARFVQLAGPGVLEVSGITLSEDQAQIARRHLPEGHWYVGDVLTERSLPNDHFDALVAIESTEYLGPDGLRALVRRAESLLLQSGLLLIVAGSSTQLPSSADEQEAIQTFDEHYVTRISSTDDYRLAAEGTALRVVAEIDLSPATTNYWRIRRDTPVLRNSSEGKIEDVVTRALETGTGAFRAYAWSKQRR